MHEMSVIHALDRIVRGHLPAGTRLLRAEVDVGSLEHLDDALMQAAWTALATEPPLAGAELVLRRVEVRARCGACGGVYVPADPVWMACPGCEAVRPQILDGGGVVLRSLEAETDAGDGEEEGGAA